MPETSKKLEALVRFENPSAFDASTFAHSIEFSNLDELYSKVREKDRKCAKLLKRTIDSIRETDKSCGECDVIVIADGKNLLYAHHIDSCDRDLASVIRTHANPSQKDDDDEGCCII